MIASKAYTPQVPPPFEQVTVAVTFQSQAEVDMIHAMACELLPCDITDGFIKENRALLCNLTEHISEALTAE